MPKSGLLTGSFNSGNYNSKSVTVKATYLTRDKVVYLILGLKITLIIKMTKECVRDVDA